MRFVFVSLGLSVIGCGAASLPATTQTPPVALCGSAAIGQGDGCVSVERLEGWLASGTYEIRDARPDGPSKVALTLALPDGTSVAARFRRAPNGLESSDDRPRRQLAAYEVQKLFLDPARYVIAPTVFTCIPVDTDAATVPLAPHDGVDCALGVLSLADESVTADGLPSSDATYRADGRELDLLSALLDEPGAAPSADLPFEPMGGDAVHFLRATWTEERLPMFQDDAIERLAKVDRPTLARFGVLTQLVRDGRRYRPTAHTPPISPTIGARWDGTVVQLGLTADEIADLGGRVSAVVASFERSDERRRSASR